MYIFFVCVDTSYDAMRSNAMFHADKRSECFQKAAEARSRKRYEVASYYAQQVRRYIFSHSFIKLKVLYAFDLR